MAVKLKHGELTGELGKPSSDRCFFSYGKKSREWESRTGDYTGKLVYADTVILYRWSLDDLKKWRDHTYVRTIPPSVKITKTLFGGIKVKSEYGKARFSKKEFKIIKEHISKIKLSDKAYMPAGVEIKLISHGINPY